MCEAPDTTTGDLIAKIAKQQAEVHTEQDATHYLANLATLNIAARGKLPEYTTMVQEFLSTLPLPMTVYMLDYYLPMLSLVLISMVLRHWSLRLALRPASNFVSSCNFSGLLQFP